LFAAAEELAARIQIACRSQQPVDIESRVAARGVRTSGASRLSSLSSPLVSGVEETSATVSGLV
jgi:hypothetical protein